MASTGESLRIRRADVIDRGKVGGREIVRAAASAIQRLVGRDDELGLVPKVVQ